MRTDLLGRHPRDGWELAEPYPMRETTWVAFQALIRALCPPEPAPDAEAIGLTVRRTMRYMPRTMASLFCATVHVLDWAPVWRLRSLRRLRSLDRDHADAVLASLAESRVGSLRTLVLAARGAVLSTYFDQAHVHERLDYEPVPFLRGRMALRQRLVSRGGRRDLGEAERKAGGKA